MPGPRPTYIDLFCGAGGLSEGLHREGWRCVLASDWWPDALETFHRNHPHVPIHNGDIRALTAAAISERVEATPDWILGGPPCQGFSTVGKRTREDPRNALIREFFRVVKEVRPPGFVIENVLGLRDMRFVAEIQRLFEGLGYSVTSHVLTSADFGVPQLRRRVVFVGHLERGWFLGPTPTHTPDCYVTVWDAIGDLPKVKPGESVTRHTKRPETEYQRLMRAGCGRRLESHRASSHPARLVKMISFIPDGGNRTWIPPRYQPRSGFHNSYSRLFSEAPAVAVTQNMGKPSGTRCIHPFQHRGLTAREGARLQSFPDRYHFAGKMMSQRLQIANAVPPLLGAALARALDDPRRWTTTREHGIPSAESALPFVGK